MSEDKDKNLEAVAKLISLTREGKIVWKSDPNSVIPKEGDRINSIFKCEYKDKTLRIYNWSFLTKNFVNTWVLKGSDKTDMIWSSQVVLEIVDENGTSLWRFPSNEMLADLLKSIKYKNSGAADLIESLLQE